MLTEEQQQKLIEKAVEAMDDCFAPWCEVKHPVYQFQSSIDGTVYELQILCTSSEDEFELQED